jgi:hypothetical protein
MCIVNISQALKFLTVLSNLIIVPQFLKFNVSIMCRYKIMKQEVSEKPLFRVLMSVFFILMAVNIKVFFSKLPYFWLYSEKVCHCKY